MIPDPVKRWATTDVSDFYYPYLEYLVYLSREIDETHKILLDKIEKESDRRLELVRNFYNARPPQPKDMR